MSHVNDIECVEIDAAKVGDWVIIYSPLDEINIKYQVLQISGMECGCGSGSRYEAILLNNGCYAIRLIVVRG